MDQPTCRRIKTFEKSYLVRGSLIELTELLQYPPYMTHNYFYSNGLFYYVYIYNI